VFTLKLVARPDARMVEVPLDIEAELPREFEGSAVLASSGLPRKVKLKAKDALKLSTAYRVDQLAGEVVKTTFRGTAQDVATVQDAVVKFIRGVRDRRQDGATLLVSSDGHGKIDALEQGPGTRTPAALESAQSAGSDALAALQNRIAEVESGLVERVAQLEARVAAMQKQMARTLAVSEVAGPGMEKMLARSGAMPASAPPRRATALDAFADGLRDELRARAAAALVRVRGEVERCDKAAAQAADAQAQGAPADGSAERLRDESAAAAARQTGLQRLEQEIDLYPSAELPLAMQLLQKLEASAAGAPQRTAHPAPPQRPPGPFGSVAENERIRPDEAAAAAASASRMPKIVPHDPSHTDEALAAEMALAVENEVTAGWQSPSARPASFEEPQGPDEVVGGEKHD
jgi:hypothetical protein